MRETQEIERLRLAFATLPPIRYGKSPNSISRVFSGAVPARTSPAAPLTPSGNERHRPVLEPQHGIVGVTMTIISPAPPSSAMPSPTDFKGIMQ